jgi:hypothetical protein
MKLERRLARLEKRQAATEEKRKLLLIEHLALRAAFVELAALISTSSVAQFAAAKGRAMKSLTDQLMEGCFSEQDALEATAALEEMFYSLAAAHSAKDQPAPSAS